MSTEEIKNTIHNLHEALNKRDIEKAASFFSEDAISIMPEGTFKGKNEIKRYFTWVINQYTKLIFKETELIVEGNKVAHLYFMEGTTAKSSVSLPCVSVLEFKNGKIQHLSTFIDRISVAKQMARGVVETTTVNAIIKRMEKGLH